MYPIPLILGKYSYEKGVNNWLLYAYKEVTTLTNPEDLGLKISDEFIVFEYPVPFVIFKYNKYVITQEEFEKIITQKLGDMQKFSFNGHLIYAKNEIAFRNALDSFYF